MEQDILTSLQTLSYKNIISYGTEFGRNLLAAIIVYFVGRFIVKKVTKIVRKVMQKRNIEPSLFTFIDSFVTIVLYFVLVIAVVSILGIETSSFVALFASAGVAIGMAMSGTLQNFAGGVMILIFRPYKVGDYIVAQGHEGVVKEILIFNTVLTTPDNQTIIVPNGGLSTGIIKNVSKEMYRRVDIPVGVAYGTKPEQVREVINAIIVADKRILQDDSHKPAIPMTDMSASSIDFSVRVWVSAGDYWGVKFDLTEAIYNELNKANIEIPFQQIDVHMKS